MSEGVPPTPGQQPRDPTDRWPWFALVLGLLVVVVAVFFFVFNRPNTAINVEGTPTPNPLARAGTASPGPPPTLVPPTLPASAPTATPAPSASPTVAPTQPPTVPPTQPPPTAAPLTAPAAAAPSVGASTQVTAAPTATAAEASSTQPSPTPSATPPPPSPTPFAGQVANPGGLSNTRQDLDGAYGAPVGETPGHLVVYRKNNSEYHVLYVPDPNGRAALIAAQPQATQQALPLAQAQSEAHKLLPKDAQPPNPNPEGNAQFVVERYTSQTLAQALPADALPANNRAPGQLLIVYVKDAQGNITRWIVGAGNDPSALVNQAGR